MSNNVNGLINGTLNLSQSRLGRVARSTVAEPATVVLITISPEKLDELTLLIRKPINVVGEIL